MFEGLFVKSIISMFKNIDFIIGYGSFTATYQFLLAIVETEKPYVLRG